MQIADNEIDKNDLHGSFFLFEGVDVDELVDDGVDGESGGGVDIEFAGDVLPVRDDGVHGDAQRVGNLFVTQSSDDLYEHLSLTFGEGFAAGVASGF